MKKSLFWLFLPACAVLGSAAWWLAGSGHPLWPSADISTAAVSKSAPSAVKAPAPREPSSYEKWLQTEGITPSVLRKDAPKLPQQAMVNDLARPTLFTSLLNQDPARVPTEKDLVQAGQLGDPLSPTGPADPAKFSDPAVQEIRKKDNTAFGHAIQTWNEHKYDAAVAMFEQHIQEFPDSPWKSESRLHIGCASQYKGQYDESLKNFGAILDTAPKGSDVWQKAMLRVGVIMTKQGLFDQAAQTFTESLKTDKDTNRTTYASSWLSVLSLYKSQQTALRDCVQKSLREVCLSKGRVQDADRIGSLPAMREDGFTAAQVIELCEGLRLHPAAVRVSGKDCSLLPAPFLAHYKDEHFVAVFSMNKDKVSLFDSRVGFRNEITLASFKAQWSGFAITLDRKAQASHDIAAVGPAELNQIIGGCCGVNPQPSPTGGNPDRPNPAPCAAGDTDPPGDSCGGPPGDTYDNLCSPKWWVDPVSLNMVVRDVPMWWSSPYGLGVAFCMNFNSQDSLTATRPFGPKWVLNYCAYAMEDPSGKVTIVAGNSRQWVFTPNGSGGYDAPPTFHCTLVKTAPYSYQLTYDEDGTVYLYGPPAGVSTVASLFLSVTDRWGVSVSAGYNTSGALTSVTHSIGGTWAVNYNTAGLVSRIDDPFGRSAYMSYDTAGALRQVTDMGGLNYSFTYSTSANPVNATTSSQMFMTQITYAPQEDDSLPNRTWHPLTYQFLTVPPDGNPSGTWSRYAITLTNPDNSREIWNYDGIGAGSHKTPGQVASGSTGTTYTYTLAGGIGHVSSTSYAGGGSASLGSYNTAGIPTTTTSRAGVTLTQTVNSYQRPLTVTDPASRVTTLQYAANGMDLTSVTTPDSVTALQVTYYSNRLPSQVTRRDGISTTMTYNSHGQLLTTQTLDSTAAAIHTAGLTYDTAGRVQSAQRDGRTVTSYTYDAVGRIATFTNEEGLVLTYTYDALNRLTKTSYPDGTSEEVAYHGIKGMKNWQHGRDGQNTLYFYDKRGLLVGSHFSNDRFLYTNYDLNQQPVQLVDSNGHTTTWAYDVEGKLLSKTTTDGGKTQYTWNTSGQVTLATGPRGLKTGMSYDSLGRLNGTTYLTSTGTTAFPSQSFTYDILDRLSTSTDGEGTTTLVYDTAGRLQSADGPYTSDTVSYTYDAASRLATRTNPGGTDTYAYDADDRLSSWTDAFGDGAATYQGHTGRVASLSRAGGLISTTMAYTAVNDLSKIAQIQHSISGSVLSQFDYTWTAQQDLSTLTRTLGSTAARNTQYQFSHDAGHQLTGATLTQVSSGAVQSDQRWGYDKAGNRTLDYDLVANVRNDYNFDASNQMTGRSTYSSSQKPWVQGSINQPGSVSLGGKPVPVNSSGAFQGQAPSRTTPITATNSGGLTTSQNWQLNSGSTTAPNATQSYAFDSEGNMLGDGTSTFEWDLKNRLTAINTGTHRTEYTYDGSDRRVQVVEKNSGSVTSTLRYVYDGLTLLEERASNNTTVLRRFYGNGHVDVAGGGTRYVYTKDHLGSLREVVQIDGTSGNPTTATLVARYDYDCWGNRTVLDGGTAATTLVLHGYTGHVYHQWSGLWLAPYRAYSPVLGRWISRDPIGISGGINLYGYVENRPEILNDLSGLCGSIPNRSSSSSSSNSGGGTGSSNNGPRIVLAGNSSGSPSYWEQFWRWFTNRYAGGAADIVDNKPDLSKSDDPGTDLAKQRQQALEAGNTTLQNGGDLLANIALSGLTAGVALETLYDATSLVKGNSILNIKTDISAIQFGDNLLAGGFTARTAANGTTIFTNGATTYAIYPIASSTGGPTAQLFINGVPKLKIRLVP